MRNSKIRFLLYVLIIFIGHPVMGQTAKKPFKVVIDAGHGAHDPGCIGSQLNEKDVNLSMALKIGKLISDNCPDVQVIYTRKTDVFVELYRRAQIANDAHADLFISIHCNAAENPQANGVETFVMGLAKSEANQAVARKENAAILKEKNYQNNYDGFEPNSPESNVIFSLYSSAYLNNSIVLASKVQKNLLSTSHFTDRGVKQAGYWVLYKVAMPSILIELGFLSNSNDQAFLAQQSNQSREATAIYNAFVDYIATVNGSSYKHLPISPATDMPKSTTGTHNSTTDKPATEEKPAATEKQETAKEEPSKEASNTTSTPPDEAAPDGDIRFKVQFLTSPTKLSTNDARLQGLPSVSCYQENGVWKYTAGNETDYQAAINIQNSVKEKYNDAFMIAFQGSKKISVKEARQLLKK